ncbi:MAG: energy-coupling factor transporter ATPase [Selenomonadaceae bacterium]|nr:energy-coupling factor transporter ATPase [Selenomonadaceae bacterium]
MPIEVKNITFTYMPGTPYEHQALRGVSFTVEEGAIVAIAGHTGSGKSTLIQHFNGLIQPTTGQVTVDGVDLLGRDKKSKAAAKEAARKVGMVFQYPERQLFAETVYEDIAFGPLAHGLTAKEAALRVREAMSQVGLDYESYRRRSPLELSGGEGRRVAIAGILALRPKYLVLDEPTAGLDPRGRKELLGKIKELSLKQGMAVVLVTHYMEDIVALAKRVVFLRRGEIILDDAPRRAFLQREALKEAGLKPPRTVALINRLSEAGLKIPRGVLTVEEAAEAIYQSLSPRQGERQQRVK